MTDNDELIDELRTLGFTHHESRCFVALMESNPATAYDVAKRAGVPRANAYAALDRLMHKGAVQPVSENPVRFAPVDPETVFDRIANETTDRCNLVVRALGRLKQPQELSHVWSITTLGQVHDKIEELIENAQERICIKGNLGPIDAHADALKRAAARKVEIVIICFGDDADAERYRTELSAKAYLHEGRGIHVGHSNHLFCMAVDNQEGLTASLREDGYGIHTRNPPVVELINSLVRHEIYLAEIFSVFGTEIEEQFGEMLMSLRESYLPKEFVDTLKFRLGAEEAVPPARSAKR